MKLPGNHRLSRRLLVLAARLDRPGYPWYVGAIDRIAGLCVRLGL